MARISTYAVDSEIVTTDKVLGTDSQGLTTKNFSFSAVKDWLNSSAVVGVVGQNTYTFQTIPGNPAVRDPGSISLPGLGGDGTAFASITSMVFSERAADNSIATNYINTLIGKQVVLMQLDNLNNFGIYNLDSFTPLQGSPGFYTAALSVDYSNGNLISDRNYGFAVYGLQPAAPPVPSLNQVTGVGSTTNNAIEVGGLTVTTPIKNYNPNIPDIGAKQDNDLRGYGDGYISDKTLAFVRLSEQAKEEDGAVRIKQGAFQAYINGGWQTVVSNFRFREDANGGYELEHKPVGFEWWIEVNSGNSDLLGLNGLPLVQQYKVSMGAYPVPLTLDGGTF